METTTTLAEPIQGVNPDELSQQKFWDDLKTIINENLPEAVESVFKTAEKSVLTIKMTIAPKKDSTSSCTFEIKPSLSKPRVKIKRDANLTAENDEYQLTLFKQV